MIRPVLMVAGAALITSCATSYAQNTPFAVYGATLSETPDSAARDLIRTYVRDVIGPDYIVDVDTLARSNILLAVDRGRGQIAGRPIPVPDVTFMLELAETAGEPICRLVPHDVLTDMPVLVLPSEIGCQLLPVVT